jgi:hypothetical protein
MYRKKTVVAMLMCATFVLIAAAPLAQSETGTVHNLIKDENGPPSTCAEWWELTPTTDGTWYGHIVNGGMRWLIIDVMDTEDGTMLIDREMYRFALYPEGWVDTEVVEMTAGHTYMITATPNGAMGTTCSVEDVFVGEAVPPVADFTVTVDGVTVVVDASPSYDPDGQIVSFDWDFGDGTTDSGMIATHTYTVPDGDDGDSAPEPVVLGDIPPPPNNIFGYTYDEGGIALPGCTVTITNTNTGESVVVASDADGFYIYDLNLLELGWEVGDVILVEAELGSLVGEAVGIAAVPYVWLDVTLEASGGPITWDVVITLTVTDADGLTSTATETVTLTYYP